MQILLDILTGGGMAVLCVLLLSLIILLLWVLLPYMAKNPTDKGKEGK